MQEIEVHRTGKQMEINRNKYQNKEKKKTPKNQARKSKKAERTEKIRQWRTAVCVTRNLHIEPNGVWVWCI